MILHQVTSWKKEYGNLTSPFISFNGDALFFLCSIAIVGECSRRSKALHFQCTLLDQFFIFLFELIIFSLMLISFSCSMIKIHYHNVTRLCHTRTILSVNRRFPGPRLVAREGDRVIVKVVNHIAENVTIHWYESLIQMLMLTI